MAEEDIYQLKMSKIMSDDEINIFAKRKIIELNVESNTITHSSGFSIINSNTLSESINCFLSKNDNTNSNIPFSIKRFSYEFLKNPSTISVNKSKFESAFKAAFDNKIPSDNIDDSGENPLMKHLDTNLSFLKFDKLLSENKKILLNKDLIKKFKENNIKVNFPVTFSNINLSDSSSYTEYSSILTELFNKIDQLKNNNINTTNITINNTLTYESPSTSKNELNNQILNNINNIELPIEKINFHLTTCFLNSLKKKGNTYSSFKRDKPFDDEMRSQNAVQSSSDIKEIKEKKKISSNFKLIELSNLKVLQKDALVILNKINTLLNDASNMIDKRLVANIITKLLCKKTNTKIRQELLEKLGVLLDFDLSAKKALGLTYLNTAFNDLENYFPMKEVKSSCLNVISLLNSNT